MINFRYCALIIDAMAIKNIVYHKSSGRFIGYTDYGKDLTLGDPDIPATEGEALVLMLVGLRGHWKTTIEYVLCNKITSNNLTCIIRNILDKGHSHNINIKSIIIILILLCILDALSGKQ